ncbi:MAG: ABC transporter ATP-binding protein, partial [Myxococcales bacterium]
PPSDPHNPHPGPSDHHPVFERLTLEVSAGQHLAIVGDSGAGRSTLADLILGFRSPTSGAVSIDGVDLRGLRLADARDQLALAREADLFEGSVVENVRAGRAGVGVDEARRALDLVDLREVIEAMPAGLQQRLPPHGAPLSSSQAVLLGLARAAAGSPRLLIVDAALDDLDEARQDRLLHRLTDPAHPWTLVLLTRHRRLASRLPRALSLSHGRLAPLSRDEPSHDEPLHAHG